jgi:hypothetical protein
MEEDHDRPRTTPFALGYRRPQPVDGMRAVMPTAILLIRIASVVFTVAGFGMMIAALFLGDSPGWGLGAIGATLLCAAAIFITAHYYIDCWSGRFD